VRWPAAALLLAALLSASSASAQTDGRPGPWALDVRAVTSPVPDDLTFYPRLQPTAVVPDRGLGLEVGAHVYLLNIGPSRLGVGASLFAVRATTEPLVQATTPSTGTGTATQAAAQDVQIDMRTIVPHISFNFGTRNGWSYLSGGIGATDVVSKTSGAIAGRREAERARALHVGGGARWFMKSHFGVGFDIRFHMVSSGTAGPIEESPPPATPPTSVGSLVTPSQRLLTVSGGFSFK
jgi:hypothetical protein